MSTTPPTRLAAQSLTWRLVAWILGCVSLVYVSTLTYSYVLSGRIMIRSAEREARSLGQASVNAVEETMRSVEGNAVLLAAALETLEPSAAELEGLLRSLVAKNQNVYGSAAAFAPYAFTPDEEYFGPYLHRSEDGIAATNLAHDSYRYWEQDWYTAAAAAGEPIWSEPYFDSGGGEVWMATYSVPFFKRREGARELRGVVTADLALDWLHELVRSIQIGHTGYGVILSREGMIVSHPDAGLMRRRRTDPVRSPEVAHVAQEMLSGRSGFVPLTDAWLQRPVRVSYSPVGSAGWSLAVLYPEDELMAEVNAVFWRLLALLVLGLLLLTFVIVMLSRRLTLPLRALVGSAAALGRGELDALLPPLESRDEVGSLTLAFHRMRDSLKEYIRNLEQTTAAKQRMESELRMAQRIQAAMLPSPTAKGPGFELAATLSSARDVGGDLYDHVTTGDRLFLLVGDVSGKGVPAALFMARTKSLFETAAARHDDPATILAEVNRALCTDNEACMFVTVFCGILALQSGELTFASGGHDAPISMPARNEPHQLEIEGGPLLGLIEDAAYPTNRISLHPGDGILVFTDGVSEALNPEGELLGIPALGEALANDRPNSADAACAAILETVKAFASGAPQSDDLTIMAVRRTPPSVPEAIQN